MNMHNFVAQRKKIIARFMRRMILDSAGNVMVIMAIALLPISAMVGSAVDMSRDYMVKSRLQAACDAGALATRKAATMPDGTISITSANSNNSGSKTGQQVGQAFFDNNFPTGLFLTTGKTFTTTLDTTTKQVNGTASVSVPPAIMQMWGVGDLPLTVTCSSRFDLSNTDIMFVLDTTGSMKDCPDNTACAAGTTSGGNSSSKIEVLKTQVVNFYNTVQTNVTSGTQVRYGFVPYSSTVNVGSIVYGLNSGYIANSMTQQSRVMNMNTPIYNTIVSGPSTVTASQSNIYAFPCNDWAAGSVSSTSGLPANQVKVTVYTFNSWNGSSTYPVTDLYSQYKNCIRNETSTVYNTTSGVKGYLLTSMSYGLTTYGTSQFETGAAVNIAIAPAQNALLSSTSRSYNLADYAALPSFPANLKLSTSWDGCIQERDSGTPLATYTYPGLPTTAYDLDIDTLPTTDPLTQWKPTWDPVVWDQDWYGSPANLPNQPYNYAAQGYYACPSAAQNLQVMANATAVQNYVNTLVAIGGTYHDIGMTWGGRLISPTGLFGAVNSANVAANGQPITARHIIFMTDGYMCPNVQIDAAHGFEKLDKRVIGTGDQTLSGCSGELTNRHNSRLLALCNQLKAKNITIWTVNFGVDPGGGTVDPNLQACSTNSGATDNSHAFYASNAATLNSTFTQIAKTIAKLKLVS